MARAHLHMQGASTVDLIKTANVVNIPSIPCFIELCCGSRLAYFGTACGHSYMLHQLHSLAGYVLKSNHGGID